MVQIKKDIIDEQNALKKAKEMLKMPMVYEVFLTMLGVERFVKDKKNQMNLPSNHLNMMVFEEDKFADQKIQKLRYILKKNDVVRKKIVKQVLNQLSIDDDLFYHKRVEENLGILPRKTGLMIAALSRKRQVVSPLQSKLQIKS